MRMRSVAGWLALLTATMLASAGCHPGEINEVSELDVVVTFYDESVDFGAFHTYAMADTIYNLNVLEDPAETDNLDRRFDADIIAQVKAEMAARGYALVDTSEAHDLRLGLGAFDTDGSLVFTQWPWWGGYGGSGWFPGWSSVDFTKGTLLVFMGDWANRDDTNEEVNAIWSGGLDGVIDGSAANQRTRIENGISQMFTQSPYLQSREVR